MNEPDLSREAAKVLHSDVTVGLPDSAELRRATVAAMEQALMNRDRVPPRRFVVALALAAGLLLVVGAALMFVKRTPAPVLTTVVASASSVGTVTAPRQAPQPLIAGRALPETSRVTTPVGGSVELEFSTGTRVQLSEASDVTLDAVDARQRLYLANGRLNAHVARVTKGSSFMVATRDAEVEVRGTIFNVEVVPPAAACGHGTTTRVSVEEGIVAVRALGDEVLVHAGETWPRCEAMVAAPPQPEPSAEASSLAAQNDLFANASALKRQGDVPGAIALYEHLLDAFPAGPLAESAAVERLKLIGEVNRADGAKAARAYLQRYPRGFARDEAKRLLDGR
jgi:ferric-dicitrate binding protein FerR (iron transport regulator)